MTGIRHFTASAIVFDDLGRVLLVHHHKVGKWLYPGGHVDDNEGPAETVAREVFEETGVHARVVSDTLFRHPAVVTHPTPYAVIEMDVVDGKVGPHRHIDFVYVMRAEPGAVTAQLAEVADARWFPLGELRTLDTPGDLPSLIASAAKWAEGRPSLAAATS